MMLLEAPSREVLRRWRSHLIYRRKLNPKVRWRHLVMMLLEAPSREVLRRWRSHLIYRWKLNPKVRWRQGKMVFRQIKPHQPK
jgi:hypothetical protein